MDKEKGDTRRRGAEVSPRLLSVFVFNFGSTAAIFTYILQTMISPSCISFLSVVNIYHYCGPSASCACSFTQGSRADISVRWLGVLSVTVN